MKQFCDKCSVEMKNLSYRYTDDCRGNYDNYVYDSLTHNLVGTLVYCPNCGSVKIDLKTK